MDWISELRPGEPLSEGAALSQMQLDDPALRAYLLSVNDPYAAVLKRSGGSGIFSFRKRRPAFLGENICGFLPANSEDKRLIHPGSIDPQTDLTGRAVRVSMSRVYIHRYPGRGIHNIVFRFRLGATLGDLSPEFLIAKSASDEENLGAQNITLFEGYTIDSSGLTIDCKTVNVSNQEDQALMSMLNDPAYSKGLEFLSTAQPVLGPLVALTTGIFKFLLRRNENRLVQDFLFGLSFTSDDLALKLAEGSYVIIQIPKDNIDFKLTDVRLETETGRLINNATGKKLEANHIILGISQTSHHAS